MLSPDNPPSTSNRAAALHNLLAIWLIVAVAAALRLHNLNWNSLNSDEAFSWSISNKPLLQLLSDSFFLRQDPHPPVYWLLLRY